MAIAAYDCDAKYPLDPSLSQPLTNAELDYLYDYFVDDLNPCLEREGIDVIEPLSRQAFKDSLMVFAQNYPTERGWAPYAELPIESLSNDEFFALEGRVDPPQSNMPAKPAGLHVEALLGQTVNPRRAKLGERNKPDEVYLGWIVEPTQIRQVLQEFIANLQHLVHGVNDGLNGLRPFCLHNRRATDKKSGNHRCPNCSQLGAEAHLWLSAREYARRA